MVKGRIELVFSSSSNPGNLLTYTTEKTYNDGKSHTLAILREGQK